MQKSPSFGKRINILHGIILNGKTVEWTNEWPYLGVILNSAKMFNCSVKEKVRKFYRSTNAILRIDGYSNDMVMLSLLETLTSLNWYPGVIVCKVDQFPSL